MDSEFLSVTPDSLLANEEFVRRVARGLVRGGAVDDVVQETFLAALCAPPRRSEALLAWLSSTARNVAIKLVRGDARRSEREERAARAERLESADAIVQRLEVQKRVVDAVLALREPYRSTVLLRFFEELGPSEIAARTGAPVNTVAARLRRAQELLRAKLASLPSEERRKLARGLAPLAGLPPLAKAALPVTALAPLELAVAGALIATAAGVWIAVQSESTAPARDAAIWALASAPSAPHAESAVAQHAWVSPPSESEPQLSAPRAVASSTDEREPVQVAQPVVPRAPGRLIARTIDARSGEPLGGVHVRLSSASRFATLDGGPDFDAYLTPDAWQLAATRPGFEPAWVSALSIRSDGVTDLQQLALEPGAGTIEGRVLGALDDRERRVRVELRGTGRHPCGSCAETTIDENGESQTSDPFERETPCSVCGFAKESSVLEVRPGDSFAFRNLASGLFALRVGDDELQPFGRPELVELQRRGYLWVELDLEPARTIDFELADAQRRPFEGRWVKDGEWQCEDIVFTFRRGDQEIGTARFSASAHSVQGQLLGQVNFDANLPSMTYVLSSRLTAVNSFRGAELVFDASDFIQQRLDLGLVMSAEDLRGSWILAKGEPAAPEPVDRERTEEDSLWPEREIPAFDGTNITADWLGEGRFRIGPLQCADVDVEIQCGAFRSARVALDSDPCESGRARMVLVEVSEPPPEEIGIIQEDIGIIQERLGRAARGLQLEFVGGQRIELRSR